MYLTNDPSTALRMAALHQADVRAAFSRRTRRSWWRRGAVAPTTVKAPTARSGDVRVPTQRKPERESVSA